VIGNEPFLKPSGNGPQLVLEVGDFDKTIEHLRRHNAQFALEPFELPGRKQRLFSTSTATNSASIRKGLTPAYNSPRFLPDVAGRDLLC
jgi:hypothetical protein